MFLSKKPFYLRHTGDYCYSAYITFEEDLSANFAIAGLNNFLYRGKLISLIFFIGKKMEASFATNKFCKEYLEGKKCYKKNCNFIHYEVDLNECFIKERGLDNRDIFQSQKTHAYRAIENSSIYQEYKLGNFENISVQNNVELPSVYYILKKVEGYFGLEDVSLRQDRFSAFEKLKRFCDSEIVFRHLDYERAEKDSIKRMKGDYYVFNFEMKNDVKKFME